MFQVFRFFAISRVVSICAELKTICYYCRRMFLQVWFGSVYIGRVIPLSVYSEKLNGSISHMFAITYIYSSKIEKSRIILYQLQQDIIHHGRQEKSIVPKNINHKFSIKMENGLSDANKRLKLLQNT